MMKRLFLIIAFWAAGVAGASAQMRLTLPQALDLALSENPTVKVAEMEVQRYDYVKRQTWGNLLPQISASGSYTRSIVKSEMRGGISFGADNTFAVQGDLSLPLFAPSVYRTLKMNDAQMATAVEAARASRIDLTAEVKKAFYNILLAEQSLAVLRESEATVQRTVDDTQVQYKHGLASEYDLLTAQVQLSNLKPTILQTENSIKLAKLMLKMYLSIPEDVEIEVVGELDALRDDVLAGTDGLTTDVTDNSDLRSLELQEEVLRRSLKAANAGRMPTLAAFGSASYTGNDMEPFNFGGAAATDDSRYFWTHPISVGLQLSVPHLFGPDEDEQVARAEKPDFAAVAPAQLRPAADRRAGALGAERPADRPRDDVRPGADRRAGPQGLQDLRHPLPGGRGDDPRTQQRAALADAGAAELLAGDLRLPFGQGRVRPHRRPRTRK